MTKIQLKRAYEPAEPSDGYRVFVDRLWPRGLSHENFHYDLWEKDTAPTTELREWFHADPTDRWPEFSKRYSEYLEALPAMQEFVKELEKHPVVTFIFGSHDTEHNQAVVLRDVAEKLMQKS